MLPPALVGEAGKGRGAKPNVKSITGVPGSSSTEPLKPRKPVPTPAPRATATSCRAGGVGRPAVALQDVPGSYSYTSIISRGFTPSFAECPPVAERVTTFGVTTPPAITRVTGGRAPPVLIQTVAPSTMTATVTPAILTSSSSPQRPINCKPLGAKHRHNPAPPKMAEPTPDPNTLDHKSAPIPVVVLDDEDSDPQQLTIDAAPSEERSPTVVPEKKARVWASPVQVKSVEAAGQPLVLRSLRRMLIRPWGPCRLRVTRTHRAVSSRSLRRNGSQRRKGTVPRARLQQPPLLILMATPTIRRMT